MEALLLFVGCVLLFGIGFLVLWLNRDQKKKSPSCDCWFGPIGIRAEGASLRKLAIGISGEIARILVAVENIAGRTTDPVAVVFHEGPITLYDGSLACGKYHTVNEWDHPWIELSTGFGDWWPQSLRDTAFAHELLHHVSGLGDTDEYRTLLVRLQDVLR